MIDTDLLSLLQRLRSNHNPLTQSPGRADSCLTAAPILSALDRLIAAVVCWQPTEPLRIEEKSDAKITGSEVEALVASLRELGYDPTLIQVDKVLRGSRSIADDRLRGLPAYRRYRGVFSSREVTAMLREHESRILGTSKVVPKAIKAAKPWRAIDFFTTEGFDKLSEEKATELYREVQDLGLKKANDRLPEYMARARKNLPRSFEPWTREERALLIEAMCYTNDGAKLASIFGRSASAVREEGKRLIWDSRQKNKVA